MRKSKAFLIAVLMILAISQAYSESTKAWDTYFIFEGNDPLNMPQPILLEIHCPVISFGCIIMINDVAYQIYQENPIEPGTYQPLRKEPE